MPDFVLFTYIRFSQSCYINNELCNVVLFSAFLIRKLKLGRHVTEANINGVANDVCLQTRRVKKMREKKADELVMAGKKPPGDK